MKKSISLLLAFGLILSVTVLFAGDFKAEQPFLITAAGQSPEGMMVKILSQKAGLKFQYDKLAQPDMLKANKTLILVSGGSTKGLGAANIDKDQEMKRVKSLIDAAKKAKMKIVTMHLGGKKRRGSLSDAFNKIAAENADYLVVLKDGDEDGFFKKIADAKKIPLKYIDKILDAKDVLLEIFGNVKK